MKKIVLFLMVLNFTIVHGFSEVKITYETHALISEENNDMVLTKYVDPGSTGANQLWDFSELNYQTDNVITEMIHYGKLKYFEKCMLPETPDEIIFGYTTDQMKFCRNNENQMWQYLIEHDLLFNSDQFTIRKLTGEAPFTSYFTNESPGRAAIWLGFRIVESFMIKNPGENIEQLMSNTDVQSILQESKYNPQ